MSAIDPLRAALNFFFQPTEKQGAKISKDYANSASRRTEQVKKDVMDGKQPYDEDREAFIRMEMAVNKNITREEAGAKFDALS